MSAQTLFTSVLIYDPEAPDSVRGPTDLWVCDGRIAAIGGSVTALRQQAAPDRVIDGGGHQLLLPGLINAHFHSPANHLKGSVRSQPLELFMLEESPADPTLAPTPREAYLRTMLAAIEMLERGVTSVQDDAFLMPAPTPEIIDAVASAYVDSGLRARIALDQPELPESEKHPFLNELASPEQRVELGGPAPADRRQLLAAYDHLIGTWHGAAEDRIRAAVSISAPQRVSPEYFAALDELAIKHDLPLYAHLLETRTQRILGLQRERFGGRSLVRYTADLGLLGPHTNVIHAVWTDDDDLDLIAAAGATIIHNPVSNLRLGSGVMPWRAIVDRGIPVALGTDEAICDDSVNVWAVSKLAGLIHNVAGLDHERWPTAREVLTALWSGGARAQGRAGELGVIVEGALADLALLELDCLTFTPLNDLDEQLVYGEDGRDVVLTMVNGEVVAEGGRVTSVDSAALLAEAREVFAARRPAITAAREATSNWRPAYQAMVRRAADQDLPINRWIGTR